MADGGGRPPRWDPDGRGVGVGDARSFLGVIDALRARAIEPGWVAQKPETHLLPQLLERTGPGYPAILAGTATEQDGTYEVRLRWSGPADADRRTIRAAAFDLIAQVAGDDPGAMPPSAGDG